MLKIFLFVIFTFNGVLGLNQNPGIWLTYKASFFEKYPSNLLAEYSQDFQDIKIDPSYAPNFAFKEFKIRSFNLVTGKGITKLIEDAINVTVLDFAPEFEFVIRNTSKRQVVICPSSTVTFKISAKSQTQRDFLELNDFLFKVGLIKLIEQNEGTIQDNLSVQDNFKAELEEFLNALLPIFWSQSICKRCLKEINIWNTGLSFAYLHSSPPRITPELLHHFLDGTIFLNRTGYRVPPIKAPAEFSIEDTDFKSDLRVLISSYSLNSGLYSLWESGKLVYNISTNSFIPINVATISMIFPQITSIYAGDLPMILECGANVYDEKHAPQIHLIENGFILDLAYLCDFLVLDGSTVQNVLTLQGDLKLSSELNITDNNLVLVIKDLELSNTQVIESTIGKFGMSEVEWKLKMSSRYLIEFVNNFLSKARIPVESLTTEKIKLDNLLIREEMGIIYLSFPTEQQVQAKPSINFDL